MKRGYLWLMAGVIGSTAIVLAQTQPPDRPQPKPGDQIKPDQPRPGETRDRDQARDQKTQPGPEHKNLEAFIGTWQVTGQCFEKGESSPESASGTVTSEWCLGNRFVKCHMKGTKGSQPIEGMGLTGYDNGKNKYVTAWADDQCTSIKTEEGTYEQGSKTYTYTGEGTGPDGQSVKCRKIVKINSNDEHTMTVFITESGKPERKVAEMTFRRTSRTARADQPDTP